MEKVEKRNDNKVEIIVAVSKQEDGKYGIGYDDDIPWKCMDELNIFKKKTVGNIVIMGRKTILSLPKLSERIIYCISTSIEVEKDKLITVGKNTVKINKNLLCAIKEASKNNPDKKIFIAGGEQIYQEALNLFISKNIIIDNIH